MSADLRKRFKAEAKIWRVLHRKATGEDFIHGHCLEVISQLYGFKDWNELNAMIKTDPNRLWALVPVVNIYPEEDDNRGNR